MARRARSRGEAIAKRFVSRQQPPRIQPFAERWRWVIEGRVQRVGFRASCNRRALDLGISGWVRNLSDGRVEVQAEGPPLALSELRAWCEVGPPGARVVRVTPSQLPITGDDWFEVRY
ncbi:acylphosphatase [Synechococcus sp. UW86]|uniref:acylphosphatase n=1 Tax=Synechococcus sp. UW86 TaxID=368491 RepID=UPI000E0E8C06|nr:acylphosphatase [Synechococcus sp. UW86]